MKKSLALAAAGLLAFAMVGCSSEPELTPEEEFVQQLSSELPPTPGSEADPTETVAVGDTISMDCYSHLPCDAELLITEITVGEECRYGTNDYGEFGEDPGFGKLEEGQQYLQMWGEFSVATAANGWTMVDDPQIIDADGFTQTVGLSVDCRNADDGHESWSTTVDEGQKARLYGSWTIPVGTESALLEDHRIELPEPATPAETSEETTQQAPALQEEAPAASQQQVTTTPPAAQYVVECLPGTPGPALWSDGTTAYSENCYQQGISQPSYVNEGDLVNQFWECMEAGGTEETCRV